MTKVGQDGSFKGGHFTSEVILWALRWHLAFPISYRDLAAMLADRDVLVDHTIQFRWVQAYAATLEQRIGKHLWPCTGSWRVDETYVKAKGVWTCLDRAVDSLGQTIGFLLSARSGGQHLASPGPGARPRRPRSRLPPPCPWPGHAQRPRNAAHGRA